MAVPAADKRWTLDHPELGTGPLPLEIYTNPDYFERERELIFRRTWLNVGRQEEIPNPGDYFVKELSVCDTSIIVIRGKDGVVRAFHNVCSHRSNRLVWETGGGSCRALACGFHNWTYDLQGNLIHVPDEEGFFDLDKGQNGLTPVAAEIWEGFVFIHLDPHPKESLKEFMGEFGEGIHGYPFENMGLFASYKVEERVNWKVLVDAQQEGYHVPFLHRNSLAAATTSKENPYCHVLQFNLYPCHRQISCWGNAQHQPSPVEGLSYRYAEYIPAAFAADEEAAVDGLPPGVNPTRSRDWSFDFNVLFPNFNLALFDGTYFTHNIWPLAIDRTVWEVKMYSIPAEKPGQQFSQEYGKCVFFAALMEDASTHEMTQSTLASGAKEFMHLQDQEVCIRHFHKVVAEHIGSPYADIAVGK